MKTKKILAITISCLLLIGAMVGFTASADEAAPAPATPAVEIHGISVSYTSPVRITYTLDAANIPEGGSLKVVFSYDADATVALGAFDKANYEYVNEPTGNITENGIEYPAVASNGLTPAEMTKKVYAIPAIFNADGTVAAVGAKVNYSAYDYFMSRIESGDYTADQYLLYIAALDFGGSVQSAQKITEGKDPEGGFYADAYYQLKTIGADGTVKSEAYREPTEVNLVAPKGNTENKLFDKFVDKDGVAYDSNFTSLALTVDKIGTTYVEYVYGETELNVAGITGVVGTAAELANADTDTVIKGGTEYYLDAEITLTEGAVAALDFMADDTVKIGTINFTEADGVVTVSDGVSEFTMANGANLKIEYTVIFAGADTGTGAIFYYVNNAYVAVSNVPAVAGTSNASFAKVVASATTGEIAVTNVLIGANDGVVAFGTKMESVTYGYDSEYGKYFVYTKGAYYPQYMSKIGFDITGPVNTEGTTVLEAKVRTNAFIGTSWDQAIELSGTYGNADGTNGGSLGAVNGKSMYFAASKIVYNGTDYNYKSTSIASNTWFDLKIEHVARIALNIYINGELVCSVKDGTAAMDTFAMNFGYRAGNFQMADVKYYNK